jgi:hypothetical protein
MGSASVQAIFFGRLAALLKANLPLLKAMEVALERVEAGRLRDALSRILDRAYQGSSLTDAFNLEGEVFSTEVLTLIASGEETGDLEFRTQAVADGLAAGTFAARPSAGTGAPPLERIAEQAVAGGATAIHVTPLPDGAAVFFRIGGALTRPEALCAADLLDLLERAHLLCGLPPEPVHQARCGEFDAAGMHVAASFCPVPEGESIVLRLAAMHALVPDLADFGLSGGQAAVLREWGERRNGIVLAAGLPGSGRTRLLRSLLATTDREARRIFAVTALPMPRIAGVSRILADPDSRAAALRAVLLQDLDAVLVDEIEGPAVATTAVRVARTGHLVLAGITAGGATEALAALLDLGLDPEDVAELVIGVAVLPPGIAGAGAPPSKSSGVGVFAVDRAACREILDQA